jgi:hypothetical protein
VEFAIETSEDGRAKAISVSGPEGSFVQVRPTTRRDDPFIMPPLRASPCVRPHHPAGVHHPLGSTVVSYTRGPLEESKLTTCLLPLRGRFAPLLCDAKARDGDGIHAMLHAVSAWAREREWSV